MGVKETYPILKKYAGEPLELCKRLAPYFPDGEAADVLAYLQSFGMYTSGPKGAEDANLLKKEEAWETFADLHETYQKKWDGPNIPILILPHRRVGFFSGGHHKSGLAFPDKLVLFLSPNLPQKEKEALFIHEYHHVCRLNRQDKKMNHYCLADSSILEGCAEFAVASILGDESYLAPWTKKYSQPFLESYWNKKFKDAVSCNRTDPKHDDLLLGKNGHPYMIGYCMGYFLVEQYAEHHTYSIEQSFSMPAEAFIDFYRKKQDSSE
ncbi:DUF2268 domain-containing protein [Bacillus sp. 1P06AnD]|uniref:DUF2268 domain-containing protein n=1 Tax=Bacillus sp. 1P06AnD TaxID=3132208 RepID=UPI00399F953C